MGLVLMLRATVCCFAPRILPDRVISAFSAKRTSQRDQLMSALVR
jgi:hypothetical protein